MKKNIYKINQYLLENYPTIWNTKIIWMLLVSFITHLVFFILGYFTLTNPESLQQRGASDIFFKNGTVFFSIILSVLLIVIWLLNLFKNNSFKNFYPTSQLKLFYQFISYFIIILFVSTFYFSYNLGVKAYMSKEYKDKVVNDEINIANKAAVFFSHDIADYTVNNLRNPAPLSDIYCESNRDLIDFDKPHLTWLDFNYQFYTLKTKQRKLTHISTDSTFNNYVYNKVKDSLITYYYKDSVVDIHKYKTSAVPTYYNFSDTFYISIHEDDENIDLNNLDNDVLYPGYIDTPLYSKRRELRSKEVQKILKENTTKEIKELLSDLLSILNKYKINYNINSDQWFDLVYDPNDYKLRFLIREAPKSISDFVAVAAEETAVQRYYRDHITDFYIQSDNLKIVFENIEEIKDQNILEGSIHVFIWLSFFLSILIFTFRITNLRIFLFTIISGGLIAVFISLTTVLYSFLTNNSPFREEYFGLYFSIFIGVLILCISLFMLGKIRKAIVGVCMNLSLISFVIYLFLIASVVSLHQRDYCNNHYSYYNRKDCFILMEDLGVSLSYILFFSGIVFVLLYSTIIKKWKGLPEE